MVSLFLNHKVAALYACPKCGDLIELQIPKILNKLAPNIEGAVDFRRIGTCVGVSMNFRIKGVAKRTVWNASQEAGHEVRDRRVRCWF